MRQKIERTITIPEQTIKKIETIITCDLCNSIASKKSYICKICARESCTDCSTFDPRAYSDHPETYCYVCMSLYNEYIKKIDEEQEKCDLKQQKHTDEWKKRSLSIQKMYNDPCETNSEKINDVQSVTAQ